MKITLGDLEKTVKFEAVHGALDPADITRRIIDLLEWWADGLAWKDRGRFETELRSLIPELINDALADALAEGEVK